MTEEIADVLICLKWVKEIYKIGMNEIDKWFYFKNNRIVERLNKGEFN